MKSLHLLIGLCTMLFIGSIALADKPAEAKGTPINKKCPVEGEDIDASVTTVHDGKTIGFCCKSCIAKFNKDPGTYLKKLADAGDDNTAKAAKSAPAQLNANCPVHTEKKVDPTETTTYKGKTIAFCCEDCRKAFDEDPEKYAKNLK